MEIDQTDPESGLWAYAYISSNPPTINIFDHETGRSIGTFLMRGHFSAHEANHQLISLGYSIPPEDRADIHTYMGWRTTAHGYRTRVLAMSAEDTARQTA